MLQDSLETAVEQILKFMGNKEDSPQVRVSSRLYSRGLYMGFRKTKCMPLFMSLQEQYTNGDDNLRPSLPVPLIR